MTQLHIRLATCSTLTHDQLIPICKRIDDSGETEGNHLAQSGDLSDRGEVANLERATSSRGMREQPGTIWPCHRCPALPLVGPQPLACHWLSRLSEE